MKKNKAILIVCRSVRETHLLSNIRPRRNYNYIVASDDIRVHSEVKNYSWIGDICWIEEMGTFYEVADDVLGFLDIINPWLASFGDDRKGIPKELLYWIRYCEGGMTSQRIQDLLLLIRSYQHLMASQEIQGIILLRQPGMQWEDEVLLQTARSGGIENIRILGDYRNTLKKRILSFMKAIAREPYYVSNTLRTKCRNRFKHADKHIENEVVFQLFSYAEKHVENAAPLMKPLERMGYHPVALCWGAEKYVRKSASMQVREQGLRAEDLEDFVPISAFISGPLRLSKTWRKVRKKREEFSNHPKLQYRSVKCGHLLWPSVRYFFLKDVLIRYRFQQAVKKYFACHNPVAIRMWGASLFQSIITLRYLKNRKKTVLFDSFISGVGFDWPYFSQNQPVDLFLVPGESRKKFLLKNNVPIENIATVGAYRYEHFADFKKTYTPAHSRAILQVPSGYKTYILFDSNKLIRGYMSAREQAQIAKTLFDFCREKSSIALMIKPHPGHQPGTIEALIEGYSLKNIFLLDKLMLPYHAINASDLVITRISTIGLEAMLFGRPVLPVLFNGEERFKIYDDASETITSEHSLKKLLNNICTDSDFRCEWTSSVLKSQNYFLQRNTSTDLNEDSSQLGAAAIDMFIKQRLAIGTSF